jgi:transposase-like protein
MATTRPARVAEQLIADAPSHAWLRELTEVLEREVRSDPLERFMLAWDLSASEAARAFGVSRQALSKWRRDGMPADRAPVLADLSAATDILERRLKPERIAAVVRRTAPVLEGASLYDLALAGRHADVLQAVTAMFDLRRVQP